MNGARAAGGKPPPGQTPVWRWLFVNGCVCLLFGLLFWKLLSLQVLETARGHEFLQDQGEARFLRTATIPAYRGMIADRRGEPLAVSTPVVSLWADPSRLAESRRLPELAEALGEPESELRERLRRQRDAGRTFLFLRRHMRPARARAILRRGIPEVRGQREYQRYYPAGAATVHLVGITDVDDRGVEGMELALESRLQGRPGSKQVIKDRFGNVVRDVGELRAARPGEDLALSIDLRLQYVAHQALRRAMAATGADAGCVVTMDALSGEVLALANHPSFNPNQRGAARPGRGRNRAVVDAVEPGSVLKPLAVAAALESGLVSPDSVVATAPGRLRVGRKVFSDPVDYGDLTVARALARSSQVGIVKLALRLEEPALWRMYSRLGLGQHPGTGFPGESAGALDHRERWSELERATLAFGHGLTATPLQLAVVYATLADDGRRRPASLLPVAPGGAVSEQVLSPALAGELRAMLEGATADEGTGSRARVPGFRVGGKTGTTHKVAQDGYAPDRYLAIFAGLAPIGQPRLVTVVLIDEPKGERYYGGEVAAPVFAEVMGAALRLLNLVPDGRGAEVAG